MAKKNIMDKVQDLLMDKKFDCAICLARTNDEHIIRSMRGNGDDIIKLLSIGIIEFAKHADVEPEEIVFDLQRCIKSINQLADKIIEDKQDYPRWD